mgnify:CR=1 FL=1
MKVGLDQIKTYIVNTRETIKKFFQKGINKSIMEIKWNHRALINLKEGQNRGGTKKKSEIDYKQDGQLSFNTTAITH